MYQFIPVLFHRTSPKALLLAFSLGCGLYPAVSQAEGGITIQGTRIIYPADAKQISVILRNTSKTDTFLVQSWVVGADGQKSKDFIVTPPLYVSNPENGNTLRLMYAGAPLPQDRETLYYFTAKAIPSVDKNATEGKNALILAAANRIKLFVRPVGLKPNANEARNHLSFSRKGDHLVITNPTPYYLTLTELKTGERKLGSVMAPPKSAANIPLPAGSGGSVSFRTISDYGALTPLQTSPVK